jgi:hypothetical protein
MKDMLLLKSTAWSSSKALFSKARAYNMQINQKFLGD